MISCGLPFIFTHISRNAGKNIEKTLFEKWGGIPSVAIFRHRDHRLDSISKQNYHKKMSELVPNTKQYTIQEEIDNSDEADNVYHAWSQFLLSRTRDHTKFNLLFIENINYGFLRNLLGLRNLGIFISCLCLLLLCIYGYITFPCLRDIDISILISCGLESGIIFFWIFWVNEKRVHVAANAYAKQLVETIEQI